MKLKRKFRKTIGILFIILGLAALLTPFTPGTWLIFVGLELIGIRFLFREKFSQFYKTVKIFFGKK